MQEIKKMLFDGTDDDFKRIVDSYKLLLYGVVYAASAHADADDIVQETYIKIMEKAFSYRKGTNARAWILSIARNIAIDVFRRRKFECDTDALPEESGRFDESSILFSMEVKRALDTLDDEERQIITMKIYAGLKHKEIGPLLGINEESCKKKYQRAIAKLRRML
jgi:RNA polymerase sigma-70 factor (ECF subfamily)